MAQKQEMIMMAPRETFAGWLARQADRPQGDPIGWLAGAWGSYAGPERPRLSSPVSIGKFLSEQGSSAADWQAYLNQAVEAATIAYREAGQQPSQPADGEQLAMPIDRLPEQHAADMDMADGPGHQMPLVDLSAPAAAAGDVVDGPGVVRMMVDLQLQLGLVMQMLAASNPAAAQVLLAQLGTEEGHDAAQEVIADQVTRSHAHEIAERNGWLAQPAQTMAGGFETWWNAAEPGAGESDG
jgi:hypothetical protein